MENRLLDVSIYAIEFYALEKDLNKVEREYAYTIIRSDWDYSRDYLDSLSNKEVLKMYSDSLHLYNRDMNGI